MAPSAFTAAGLSTAGMGSSSGSMGTGVRDVAVWGERIARVAAKIDAARADLVVPAEGLYVVPGLVDIHVHAYAGTGGRAIAGDGSVIHFPVSVSSVELIFRSRTSSRVAGSS